MTVSRSLARRVGATAAATAFLAAAAPAAHAQSCVGRPGASALQQYCEAVPEANGDRQKPQSSTSSSSSDSGSNLPSSSKKVLSEAGTDGAAVAALAAAGGSGGSGSGGSGSGSGGSGGSGSSGSGATGSGGSSSGSGASVQPPTAPSGSALSAAKQAVETGPTAGPALAWSLLGMSAAGALGALFIRRRGATLPAPGDDA